MATTGIKPLEDILKDIGSAFGGLTIKAALEQAAFLICCDILAQDIAKAPIQLRERLPNGTSRLMMPDEHPIAELFALDPNRRHTWREVKEMMVYWFALVTNSYALVNRAMNGDPLEIVPLRSSMVLEGVVPGTGEVVYNVSASTEHERALIGSLMRVVPERDMIHVRGRMIDGFTGYSTMKAGNQTLKIGAAIDKYRENLFGEEGQIRGVFTKEGMDPLSDVAFERLRQQMGELMNRFRKQSQPIVLESGMKFERISSNPKEAELTQQLEAQIVSTLRLLRIPPHKAFHLAAVKYENMEVMEKAYVGDTLEPIFQLFEERYERVLLTRKDRLKYTVQFDRESIMLKDTKTQTERVTKAVERGMIEIDEGRSKFGWNPLPNGKGEVRLIPTNMTLVDRDNKVIIGGTNTGAEPDEPTGEGESDDEAAADKQIRLISSK